MKFPLSLTFKLMALAPQIYVRDADGQLRLYVKQKLLKLKEAVTVFGDEAQTRPLYHIKADRVIDFSATYNITDTAGAAIGAIKRAGMRSLWKSHYDITRGGQTVYTVREENAWVKVIDGLVGQIPVVGMLTGYMFHPAYLVARPDGTTVVRIAKQPALWEGRYKIEEKVDVTPEDEALITLGLLMLVLLERRRG